MYLAEPIFLSFQWEWPNTWKPSIFVRFYGCNLNCKWCDSKYAVNKPDWMLELSVAEAVNEIKKFLPCKNVVFTGWEPSLFELAIEEIIGHLPWYTFEIETNWSKPIQNLYDQINISPKLSNSGNADYPLNVFKNFVFDRRFAPMNVCFKFVAKTKEDCDEIQEFIERNNIPKIYVRIMPEWTTKNSQKNDTVIEFCLKNNYRYCLRQHILLFWNKKWV